MAVPMRSIMPNTSSTRPSPGFSLLEVILAIALSAVVVAIVASGIEFHLRQLTVRKTQIEEAQLARAVLRRIADDLRSAVVDRPVDFSSVADLLNSGDGGETGESEDEAGEDSGESDSDESATAEEILTSGTVPETPGLYGTTFELQVDISRLPRYEEYALAGDYADVGTLTTLSDVKTVSYFLLGSGANTSAAAANLDTLDTLGLPPSEAIAQGLGRRVLDRSVARFAADNGNFTFVDQQIELVAPEVQWIEFRYFDGEQWQLEWNTEELGGIPLAVEITLVLRTNDLGTNVSASRSSSTANSQLSAANSQSIDSSRVYRLVVHLPASEILPTEEESAEGDTSTEEDSP